jgi:NAD-dependent dihydropyrimidine dehydrogenase PreA subunit
MAGRAYMGIPRDKIPWRPHIDSDKCIGCAECLDVCPNNVFALNDGEGKMEVVNPNNCVVLCDKCAGFCSEEAISFPDKGKTKQLLKRLIEERQQ